MKPVDFPFKYFKSSFQYLCISVTLSACSSGQSLTDQLVLEPDIEQAIEQEPLSTVIPIIAPDIDPPVENLAATLPEPASSTETTSVIAPDPESSAVTTPVSLPESETPSETIPVPVAVVEPQTGPNPLSQVPPADVSCSASFVLLKASLLELTNQSRRIEQTCGNTIYQATQALEWDESLGLAASNHSTDMSEHNFFSHTGSDGSRPSQRTTIAGFPTGTIGENIAAGQRNAGSAQNGWMESEGHCKNIMNPGYTHMGASCVENSGTDFTRYWTVVFGRK